MSGAMLAGSLQMAPQLIVLVRRRAVFLQEGATTGFLSGIRN
ncbi:hypothetical protein ACRARG_16520 [Pseudooceanicola sp. C21-150M6]